MARHVGTRGICLGSEVLVNLNFETGLGDATSLGANSAARSSVDNTGHIKLSFLMRVVIQKILDAADMKSRWKMVVGAICLLFCTPQFG
jgi:hypothetical protein